MPDGIKMLTVSTIIAVSTIALIYPKPTLLIIAFLRSIFNYILK